MTDLPQCAGVLMPENNLVLWLERYNEVVIVAPNRNSSPLSIAERFDDFAGVYRHHALLTQTNLDRIFASAALRPSFVRTGSALWNQPVYMPTNIFIALARLVFETL